MEGSVKTTLQEREKVVVGLARSGRGFQIGAMPYEIIVNRELCESRAECVSMAPEVFELDDEEFCVVLDPEGAKDKRILDAARACPVDAITLIDARGEQVWP
jgi:ferredoxin